MLLHGDEMGRTQRGNNNGYCQDNEISWQPWVVDKYGEQLLQWTKRVVAFRARHAVLRRRNYFRGRPIRGGGVSDIIWLGSDGGELTEGQWRDSMNRCIGVLLTGSASDLTDMEGKPIRDATLLILMNSNPDDIAFTLPNGRWYVALDSANPNEQEGRRKYRGKGTYPLRGRSLTVLIQAAGR